MDTHMPAGRCQQTNEAVSKRPTHNAIMSESSETHGQPPEGLCCLATMEDITIEDGNYGTSQCLVACGCFGCVRTDDPHVLAHSKAFVVVAGRALHSLNLVAFAYPVNRPQWSTKDTPP
jgi:hypothetical protein